MARSLDDLLSGLPERKRQEFLKQYRKLPGELQRELIQYMEKEGDIPSLRHARILFGPECSPPREPHGWMLM